MKFIALTRTVSTRTDIDALREIKDFGRAVHDTFGTVKVQSRLSLELDHLCRVRASVNPMHLEVAPHRENTLRGEEPVWCQGPGVW